MKVYLVMCHFDCKEYVLEVFSDKELAEKYISEQNPEDCSYSIEEWKVR